MPLLAGGCLQACQVDIELGESAVVSRQHAKIYYNFELKRWELAVELGNDLFDVPGSSEGPQRYLQSNPLQAGGSELGFNMDSMMPGYGASNIGSAEMGMLTPGVNGNSMGLMYEEGDGDAAVMIE
eukprot:gene3804-4061_t